LKIEDLISNYRLPSSGLVSVITMRAILQKALKDGYNLAMKDFSESNSSLKNQIDTIESEVRCLKTAKKEAEINFQISKHRLIEIDSRIFTAEKRINDLKQGQLEIGDLFEETKV